MARRAIPYTLKPETLKARHLPDYSQSVRRRTEEHPLNNPRIQTMYRTPNHAFLRYTMRSQKHPSHVPAATNRPTAHATRNKSITGAQDGESCAVSHTSGHTPWNRSRYQAQRGMRQGIIRGPDKKKDKLPFIRTTTNPPNHSFRTPSNQPDSQPPWEKPRQMHRNPLGQ